MLQLVWRAKARRDVRHIVEHIAERNPDAAGRMRALFARVAEALPTHPYLYRPGRVPGTREAVVHPNCILTCHVVAAQVIIVPVIHARQQYP